MKHHISANPQRTLALLSALFISLLLTASLATAMPYGWGGSEIAARHPRARYVSSERHLRRERIRGVVERVNGQRCVVRTSSGRHVTVMLGPESYWEYRGYSLRPGSAITVDSWYDPEERSDVFFAGSISGPGFSFSLTNGSGVPYWVDETEYREVRVPTYEVYDVWYQPSYHYVAPHHVRHVPPGHVRSHRETHEDHDHGHRHGRR